MNESQIGLNAERDLIFHRHFWRVQRVARVVWGFILTAAVIGYLGPGLKGNDFLHEESSKLSLTLERFVRYQSQTELNIHVPAENLQGSSLRLFLNRSAVEGFDELRIIPEPDKMEWDRTGVKLLFNAVDRSGPLTVTFRYQPKQFGTIPIELALGDNPPLTTKQFCFP